MAVNHFCDPEGRKRIARIHGQSAFLGSALERSFIPFLEPHGFHHHGYLGRTEFDFTLDSARIAVEIMGCYWHHCARCRDWPEIPSHAKAIRNDRRKRLLCARHGWTLLEVWEHETHHPGSVALSAEKILAATRALLLSRLAAAPLVLALA